MQLFFSHQDKPRHLPIATVIYHYVIYDDGYCIYKTGNQTCTQHHRLHTNKISPIAELKRICPVGSTKTVYWMDEDCVKDCECKFNQPTDLFAFLHPIFALNWGNVLFFILLVFLIVAIICLFFQCVETNTVRNATNVKRVRFTKNVVDETTPLRFDSNKRPVEI
jgi:hypothetical protein